MVLMIIIFFCCFRMASSRARRILSLVEPHKANIPQPSTIPPCKPSCSGIAIEKKNTNTDNSVVVSTKY